MLENHNLATPMTYRALVAIFDLAVSSRCLVVPGNMMEKAPLFLYQSHAQGNLETVLCECRSQVWARAASYPDTVLHLGQGIEEKKQPQVLQVGCYSDEDRRRLVESRGPPP